MWILALFQLAVAAEHRSVARFLPHRVDSPVAEIAPGPWSISFLLPPGVGFNSAAPSWMALFDAQGKLIEEWVGPDLKGSSLQLKAVAPKQGPLRLQGTFYTCEKSSARRCWIQSRDQKIELSQRGAKSLEISFLGNQPGSNP